MVFGKATGFGAALDLSTLDGSNGFRIDGIDISDFSGRSVSSAGDVNGDGFDDIMIGASGADPGGDTSAGESYVVFGKATGFGAAWTSPRSTAATASALMALIPMTPAVVPCPRRGM